VIRNPLLLGAPAAANPTSEQLTQETLQGAIDEAIASWQAAGISPEALGGLRELTFAIDNLPGNLLGYNSTNAIVIDSDGAGYGYGKAADRVDLTAVVEHEIGHALGFDHGDEHAVMNETLALGPWHHEDHDVVAINVPEITAVGAELKTISTAAPATATPESPADNTMVFLFDPAGLDLFTQTSTADDSAEALPTSGDEQAWAVRLDRDDAVVTLELGNLENDLMDDTLGILGGVNLLEGVAL